MSDTSDLVEELSHLIPRYSSDQSIIDAAATALTAKDKEIEALRADCQELRLQAICDLGQLQDALERAETAERERDEAKAALKLIADVAADIPDDWDDDHQCVTACGHFRRAARAVIKQGE